MNKKFVIYSATFILLLLSIVFANSYVQALSRERKSQEMMSNCYNYCEQNENCRIYTQNNDDVEQSINQNYYCSQENNNCRRNNNCNENYNCGESCNRRQECAGRMCNR